MNDQRAIGNRLVTPIIRFCTASARLVQQIDSELMLIEPQGGVTEFRKQTTIAGAHRGSRERPQHRMDARPVAAAQRGTVTRIVDEPARISDEPAQLPTRGLQQIAKMPQQDAAPLGLVAKTSVHNKNDSILHAA